MKPRITLGEKLKDLRTDRKLILSDVEEATGISTSTLQRMEADADIRVGYQDIVVLAKFYGVSTDLLFGLTDNDEEHRVYEIDQLRLTDAALDVLKDGKLNNRLISEFLSHADFPQLLSAMEIYIDRKVLPQMNTMNAMYKYAEQTIKENATVPDGDSMMAFLQEAVVDEDEYLRYRISERFNMVIKCLFDSHKNDAPSTEYQSLIDTMKEDVNTYLKEKEKHGELVAKVMLMAKQWDFKISHLTEEELAVLAKIFEKSGKFKRLNKRK